MEPESLFCLPSSFPFHTSIYPPSPLPLHRVRQTRKVEILRLDGWHHDWTTLLRAADTNRGAERLEIAQEKEWRLVEAEVLDRLGDLPVLDQERPVAREAREQNRARINRAEIPQPRDENAARSGLDHVVHRRRAAFQFDG